MIQDWLKRLQAFWGASRRNQIILAASCLMLIALVAASITTLAHGGASANGTTQATATPLQQTATPAGTPQPTATLSPTPTPLPTKPVNQPIVGGTEAGFTKTFGKPVSTGVDPNNNQPTITYKGNGPIGSIAIELDSSHGFVVGVVVSAQKDSPWDMTSVSLICPHFAPSDTTFDPAQSITDQTNTSVALYQLGHSRLLASTLPESVFIDNQGQPTTGGTFTSEIYYIAGTNGKYAYACSLRLGDQPVSPAG